MFKQVDLHVHTAASDGMFTPSQVIHIAKEQNLSTLSITDHDTIRGVDEAVSEGKKVGLEVIPGIEISVDYESEMHILGYYVDTKNSELCEFMKKNEERRKNETILAIHKLSNEGIKLDLRKIKAEQGVIRVSTIINEMIVQQYISDEQEAYDRYFGRGKIAYVKGYKLDPYKSIQLIKKAGGIAILAHLHRITDDLLRLEDIVDDLKEHGLDGLECYYPTYTKEMQEKFISFAKSRNMIITGGSDFHGDPKRRLGYCTDSEYIPYTVVDNIQNGFERRNNQ